MERREKAKRNRTAANHVKLAIESLEEAFEHLRCARKSEPSTCRRARIGIYSLRIGVISSDIKIDVLELYKRRKARGKRKNR